ncbi:MAG: hypothetical protein MUQ65_09850 [Armatimonadetes bacterium]|nr:hypothetical protein [Armatimonadota bacterium]
MRALRGTDEFLDSTGSILQRIGVPTIQQQVRQSKATAVSRRNDHHTRLLREFIDDYYHTARPHQGLAGETPRPQAPPGEGELISIPIVGGLHHRYYRAAA